MGRNKYLLMCIVPVILAALMIPCHVMAQQAKVIELTYGTPYAADHAFSLTDQKWIAKIEKETNGRVKIKPYWGGAIIGGRDAVEELTQGAVDMAFINPATSKSGFLIHKASYLFFYGANQTVGARVFKELLKKFPEIEGEYKGMKVLCWGGSTHQLITRKPVRRIADLKGMRLKSLGDMAGVLKELGVEGISLSNAEVYVALQKGIIDGLLSPAETLEVLKLSEVAKYVTLINLYKTHSGMRAMNLAKWNSLPPDIKQVFERNIDWYGQEADDSQLKGNQHAMEDGKKLGVEFITLPKDELDKFYAPMKAEAIKEAQALDAKGLPGTKILSEAQRLIQLYSK
ncbi:MAG TPA: TRAP transporter substrate-binding protein DctP [Syntrophorhabdaceae bacterium]|nr:TRAP transporter substrate-binding protein DctP [Syntrophorhabdaceae bacterium]